MSHPNHSQQSDPHHSSICCKAAENDHVMFPCPNCHHIWIQITSFAHKALRSPVPAMTPAKTAIADALVSPLAPPQDMRECVTKSSERRKAAVPVMDVTDHWAKADTCPYILINTGHHFMHLFIITDQRVTLTVSTKVPLLTHCHTDPLSEWTGVAALWT
jgi:hypothetical protein